jgi:hypothetical protein
MLSPVLSGTTFRDGALAEFWFQNAFSIDLRLLHRIVPQRRGMADFETAAAYGDRLTTPCDKSYY